MFRSPRFVVVWAQGPGTGCQLAVRPEPSDDPGQGKEHWGRQLNRHDASLTKRKGRDVAIELWHCFDQGRFRDALPLLSDDFEAHWPNTRERIQGPENFIALNESYPGDWRCTVRRIDECADTVVTVTEISDGDTSLVAVSFLEVRHGCIVRAEEYFAENGPPPFDRSAFAKRY